MTANNEQPEQQPMSQEAAALKIGQAFTSMADAMMAITAEQEALKAKLNEVITNQNAQVHLLEQLAGQVGVVNTNQDNAASAIQASGNLMRAMNDRIVLVTELVNAHHKIFIAQGWAKGPDGGSLAN